MERFLYLLTISFLLLSSCISDDEPEVRSLVPGDRCPEFAIMMNDGAMLTSSDLQGDESIIVFFNTACGDCRKELPVIQEAYDNILSRNLTVKLICISRAENAQSVGRYWKENGLTLPYSAQDDTRIYNLFASSIIPRIYILSSDLVITGCWNDNPMPSADEIMQALH
ncbi:MAG: TlpA family protein disulfide reductase [Muribaculaceae bacterium]|nr:TlpA family protein disulfide reductase [Muribaculaceae bacterium]